MTLVHIVVVGCGRVGSDLATQLSEDGHSVAIIDKNAESFRRLGESFNGKRIVGSGFDRTVLSQAGASEAQAFAAVTNGDNTNILCARIAQSTYGIKDVVARIYDPQRAAIYQRLGIPTVATVTWTTSQVKRWLLNEDETIAWTDDSATVMVLERFLPDTLAGKPVQQLNVGNDIRVVAVVRGSQGRLDIDGLYGQEDDKVLFMVTPEGARQLNSVLGIGQS
jgi:trk system potassium uptake protein TrkA